MAESVDGVGPSVEAALSMSPTTAQMPAEAYKPTIGARKPAPAKKGVGYKQLIFCNNLIFINYWKPYDKVVENFLFRVD